MEKCTSYVPIKRGANHKEILFLNCSLLACLDHVESNFFLLFCLQVYHLLKDVDPSFIKEFVSKTDALFLNSFAVTPNCHRVTELIHPFSTGQKLIFVGELSFNLCYLVHLFPPCEIPSFCPIFFIFSFILIFFALF